MEQRNLVHSPLQDAIKITVPNKVELIEAELRQYFKAIQSFVFIDPVRTLTPYSIIDDAPRVLPSGGAGSEDTLYVVFIQYPYILAAVTEEGLARELDVGGGKLTLCRLISLSYRDAPKELDTGAKRRKLNHVRQLESLVSLEKIFNDASLSANSAKMYQTPFPHGEGVMDLPQVGAEGFLTICQCYNAWFGAKASKLDRLGYELSTLDAKGCSSQELEVMCSTLYKTWQRVKKSLIEKQL